MLAWIVMEPDPPALLGFAGARLWSVARGHGNSWRLQPVGFEFTVVGGHGLDKDVQQTCPGIANFEVHSDNIEKE
jgi:hypothetical protein